jgi:hypothetical protein
MALSAHGIEPRVEINKRLQSLVREGHALGTHRRNDDVDVVEYQHQLIDWHLAAASYSNWPGGSIAKASKPSRKRRTRLSSTPAECPNRALTAC